MLEYQVHFVIEGIVQLLEFMLTSMIRTAIETMLISVVFPVTGGHVGVHVLGYLWRPYRCVWPILLPEATLMSAAHAATKGYVGDQGPATVRGCVDVCVSC